MRRMTGVVAILLGIVLIAMLTGCQAAAEKATEAAIEGATGIDVEEDGDSVTIETDEGTVEVNTGEDGSLPDGFPDDFPVYDGTLSNQGAITTDAGSMWSVTVTTPDSYDDVVGWYKNEFAGSAWKQEGLYEASGEGRNASFALKKDENSGAGVIVTEPSGGGDIEISITINVNTPSS